MQEKPKSKGKWKSVLAAGAAATLTRALGLTWRTRLHDPHGYSKIEDFPEPKIWIFWHNRVMGMPIVYSRLVSHRRAVVLTSPSGDGDILAMTMAHFKLGAVRGSSSRRGARALKELVVAMRGGSDVIITPDGPRGPKYTLHPGVVQLASLTGATVVPIVVEYSRFWSMRTWDAFRIPKPGSVVTASMQEGIKVPPKLDESGLEEFRKLIETRLRDAGCEGTESV